MILNFELVPDSCWYSNLRSILSKEQWSFIRRNAIIRAGGKCMICGSAEKPLEAHEQWEYDEKNAVQKLKGVVAVCKRCHEVIHIGRTTLTGGEERACEHFMKVNGCSYAEYRRALGEANTAHIRRNEIPEWKLDISWLKGLLN